MGWVKEKKFVTANRCEDLEENGGNVLKLIVITVQETPGIQANSALEYSRAKANRLCQENVLVIANTLFQQHKRRLYTWTSPDGQHQNQIDYILCSQRWRSSIQ